MTLLAYLGICVLPLVLGQLAIIGMRWFVDGPPWRRGIVPSSPPLERLVADLRRLEQAYRAAEEGDAPARVHRMRAIQLAYDDTLRSCCASLGLDAPQGSPLSAIERLEVQAELAQRGLRW